MMNNNTCTQLSEHLDVTNLRIMLAKEKTFNTRKLLDRYLVRVPASGLAWRPGDECFCQC